MDRVSPPATPKTPRRTSPKKKKKSKDVDDGIVEINSEGPFREVHKVKSKAAILDDSEAAAEASSPKRTGSPKKIRASAGSQSPKKLTPRTPEASPTVTATSKNKKKALNASPRRSTPPSTPKTPSSRKRGGIPSPPPPPATSIHFPSTPTGSPSRKSNSKSPSQRRKQTTANATFHANAPLTTTTTSTKSPTRPPRTPNQLQRKQNQTESSSSRRPGYDRARSMNNHHPQPERPGIDRARSLNDAANAARVSPTGKIVSPWRPSPSSSSSSNRSTPSSPYYASPQRKKKMPSDTLSRSSSTSGGLTTSSSIPRTPRSALGGRRATVGVPSLAVSPNSKRSAAAGGGRNTSIAKLPNLDDENDNREKPEQAKQDKDDKITLYQRLQNRTAAWKAKAKALQQELKENPVPKTDEDYENMGDTVPKSLLIIWVVVMVELVLDLVTTMIAFRAFAEDGDCCGSPLTIGVYPALLTTPFFCLVASEMALLLRAILLTAFPKLGQPIDIDDFASDVSTVDGHDEQDEHHKAKQMESSNIEIAADTMELSERKENQGHAPTSQNSTVPASSEEIQNAEANNTACCTTRTRKRIKRRVVVYLCCWLQWKARLLMATLDLLVLLNPFFGCFVAWTLMYQSNRNDAFTVLGMEGASLALHYVSVYIEGAITDLWSLFMQGFVPFVPFVTSVSLVLYYLKQGGVCYLVASRVFKFTGCEVCIDGYPPVDGICYLQDGSSYNFVPTDLLSPDAYSSLEKIVERSDQVSYCAADNPEGPPDINFCFFDFDTGQMDGIVVNPTEAPTRLPALSSNVCGATVPPGEWQTTCANELWNPSGDDSLFCFASGGLGDPCHLNIVEDGVNEGRFKDPTPCTLSLRQDGDYFSYGDVLYLWEDPSANGFGFDWAANAWLAYSLTRWGAEMTNARSKGLRVSTPSVTIQDESQAVAQMQEFFDSCGEDCNNPASIAFIDVLAVHIFCNPSSGENCTTKVSLMSSTLRRLSSQFGDRPVHITKWGAREANENSADLATVMDATGGYSNVVDDLVLERVFWYGGNGDQSNLRLRNSQGKRLGRIWSELCSDISPG